MIPPAGNSEATNLCFVSADHQFKTSLPSSVTLFFALLHVVTYIFVYSCYTTDNDRHGFAICSALFNGAHLFLLHKSVYSLRR